LPLNLFTQSTFAVTVLFHCDSTLQTTTCATTFLTLCRSQISISKGTSHPPGYNSI
jgi:hypothetical protein